MKLDEIYNFDRDHELCKLAAKNYACNSLAKNGILFRCFNNQEAENLKRIMTELYPDVPIFFEILFNNK